MNQLGRFDGKIEDLEKRLREAGGSGPPQSSKPAAEVANPGTQAAG
jgi:hypothetical protein